MLNVVFFAAIALGQLGAGDAFPGGGGGGGGAGSLSGSGADNRLACWSSASALDSNAGLTCDGSSLGAGAIQSTGSHNFSNVANDITADNNEDIAIVTAGTGKVDFPTSVYNSGSTVCGAAAVVGTGAMCVADNIVASVSGAAISAYGASNPAFYVMGTETTSVPSLRVLNSSGTVVGQVVFANSAAEADLQALSLHGVSTIVQMSRFDDTAASAVHSRAMDNTTGSGNVLTALYGAGLKSNNSQSLVVADSGGAGAATASLDPAAPAISVVCNDTDTGCTVTFQETTGAAINLDVDITVCVLTQVAGVTTFPAVANVFACGDAAVTTTGLNVNDCFTAHYRSAMWMCTAPSSQN